MNTTIPLAGMPFERKWLLGFVDKETANCARWPTWIAGNGARWVRLGVVAGNARAERFWHRAGYREVRRRQGVVMGERVNAVVVMVKSLAATDGLSEYLAVVARDRPESS
jgi:hypothetical protein